MFMANTILNFSFSYYHNLVKKFYKKSNKKVRIVSPASSFPPAF